MVSFSFSSPINLSEEKWLIAVTGSEATNSVFNITDENNSFSITIAGCWYCRGGEETIKRLREILGIRAREDIDLHGEDLRKRVEQKNRRQRL